MFFHRGHLFSRKMSRLVEAREVVVLEWGSFGFWLALVHFPPFWISVSVFGFWVLGVCPSLHIESHIQDLQGGVGALGKL